MNWKNHLVAIFTPNGDGVGHWGTGIPVANGHVLTARHVLYPGGCLGDTIRLCWWGSGLRKIVDGKKCRVFEDVPRDEIVWENEVYDVALIKCSPPTDVPGWLALDTRKPSAVMTWESEGFPRVAEIADQQDAASFRGGMTSARDDEVSFTLDVESPPAEEHMWGGASGMPVISLNNKKILGVCLAIPRGYNANRLHATPVWKLCKLEKFRQFLELDTVHADCKTKLKLQIKNALPSSSQWISDFANALGKDAVAALSNGGEAFADFIVNGDDKAETILNLLHDFHLNRPDHSESIRMLGSAIVPAVIGFLRTNDNGSATSLFDGTVGLRTMAEISGSALDGRVSDFRPRKHANEYPCGRRWIPIAPEVGPNGDAEKIIAKWILQDFENRVCPPGMLDAVSHHLLHHERVYEPQQGGGVQDLDESIKKIGRRLRRIFNANQFRYYLTVPTASLDESQLVQLRSAIEEIKNVLPELLVFELDDALEEEDEDALANFPFMLPIEGREH